MKPALPSRHTSNAAASIASRPATVTIAMRPSMGRDGAGSSLVLILATGKAEYFSREDWTAELPDSPTRLGKNAVF
jgi:hypothetical protein